MKTKRIFIETQTREKNTSSSTALPGALTFSMDAQIIASVHGNSVYVWETATGTSIAILDKHPAAIKTLALSPDSAQLATTGEDWKVHLWDVKTGKAIRSLDHPSAVNAVAFSPDGKRLASAGGTLRLWDAYTGELLHADSKDLGSVNLLIFSPNGKILASGGEWDHTVHLWDVKTGTPKRHSKDIPVKFATSHFHPTDTRSLLLARTRPSDCGMSTPGHNGNSSTHL